MKKTILSLFIGIFLIGLASASISHLGSFKQGECVELPQSCTTCTYNNISRISVEATSQSIISQELPMQKIGILYNYSFCNTSVLGKYIVEGHGDLDGTDTIWNYDFDVTPIGLTQTISQGIGSAVYLILMLVLMFVFGFVGFRLTKTENWWILGIFFMFLSSLFLVYNTWLGYEYHRLFTGLPDSAMPETIFWIFLLLIAAGILASAILLFRHWRKVIRYIKKEMKRKEPDDATLEDWDLENMTGEVWGPPKGLR